MIGIFAIYGLTRIERSLGFLIFKVFRLKILKIKNKGEIWRS